MTWKLTTATAANMPTSKAAINVMSRMEIRAHGKTIIANLPNLARVLLDKRRNNKKLTQRLLERLWSHPFAANNTHDSGEHDAAEQQPRCHYDHAWKQQHHCNYPKMSKNIHCLTSLFFLWI